MLNIKPLNLFAIVLCLCFTHVIIIGASTTCNSSSNCTLREWLVKLKDESSALECSLSQLEKSTALLSKVNYLSTSTRLSQIEKFKKSISILKGEIEIITLTCSTYYGPDCNLTTPECDSKCISCGSKGQCTSCSGNFDGPTCSSCKSGWNGTLCNVPICDAKCTTCMSPGVCSQCIGNWDGPTCSSCKSGWTGTDCNTPICDAKCSVCTSPGVCSQCIGNWIGTTCSTCKSGWNGTDCSSPICDSKCNSCASPGVCSNCIGNWIGTTCSSCKNGWTGTDCNTPICDSKCSVCTSPGVCSQCIGNWNGTACSSCKTGWNGTLCNVPICDSKCNNCSSPGVCSQCIGNWIGTTCSTCKTGWNGPDCSSNLILTSAQITKFTNLILPSAQLIPSKLLFKATIDGFSASAFHSKCDNKGATITIIKATSGAIFGGYASISWSSSMFSYAQDQTAFIFSLVAPSLQERFVKLTQDNPSLLSSNKYYYSLFLGYNYGPTFGGGFDLSISDNSNVSTSQSQLCATYCDATMYGLYGYQTDTTKNYLAGSYRFLVEDYEVYSL